jgi:hypothetical protein
MKVMRGMQLPAGLPTGANDLLGNHSTFDYDLDDLADAIGLCD